MSEQTKSPAPVAAGVVRKAEHLIDDEGAFLGHEGLRGLAECDEFWEKQDYGTRLYYGDGTMDYLHRSVLRAAIAAMDKAAALLQAREGDARDAERLDPDCICFGNWRSLVKEYEGLLDKKFVRDGKEYTFYGLVWADDDFYFGMYRQGDCVLSSCVGSLETNGFTLQSDAALRDATPPASGEKGDSDG